MDTQRIASPATAHGAHAARQRASQGELKAPGAFSALLSELGEPMVGVPDGGMDAPVSANAASHGESLMEGAENPASVPLDPSLFSWQLPALENSAADSADAAHVAAPSGATLLTSQLPTAPAGAAVCGPIASADARGAQPISAPVVAWSAPPNKVSAAAISAQPVLAEGAPLQAAALAAPGAPVPGKSSPSESPRNLAAQSVVLTKIQEASLATGNAPMTPTAKDGAGAPLVPLAVDTESARTPQAGVAFAKRQAVDPTVGVAGRNISTQRSGGEPPTATAQASGVATGALLTSPPPMGLVSQTARMDADAGGINITHGEGLTSQPGAPAKKSENPAPAFKALVRADVADGARPHFSQISRLDPMRSRKALPSASESGVPQQTKQDPASLRANLGEPLLAPSMAAVAVAVPVLGAERRSPGAPARSEDHQGGASAAQGFGERVSLYSEPSGAGTPDATALSPEDAITEQVTYWLGENLKNAELTVDHAGQAIDVRVSLTGNEAHVVFRSDQAQMRELLDAGMGDLRELLRSEGLVLSGVSVDSQGTDPQRQPADDRPSNGGAAPAPAGSSDAHTGTARRILTDHSVDLFV